VKSNPGAVAVVEDDAALLGQTIAGKYTIQSLIGRGGMGTVWRATELGKNRDVAVKVIRPQYAEQDEARRRFEIEAHAAAQVDSPHAVRIYDHGSFAGVLYIAMELLEGESLSEAIARQGAIALPELACIVEQAASALEKAHEKGIIHRDLKPDNFFLATNGARSDARLPYAVKLVDFGIAKILDRGRSELSGPTQTGMVIGTPTFMSPEQLTEGGEPDIQMDVWSMGVTIFTAATGRLPFEGDVMGELVLKVCVEPMPVPSRVNRNLPVMFDKWFAQVCSRDRRFRFQSVRALSDALSAFADPALLEESQLGLQKRSFVPSMAPENSGRMNPKMGIGIGIMLGIALIVALFGLLALQSKLEQERQAPPTTVPSR
jgi:eukaryotic-like serine/threonine-protein kinase